mmetsp:Transcript_62861/g.148111  ORF Transcript_62861/g.148111 Transcript_62861/m.148111 type:complete len:169 (-) Transcript_62861:654-1160(-)
MPGTMRSAIHRQDSQVDRQQLLDVLGEHSNLSAAQRAGKDILVARHVMFEPAEASLAEPMIVRERAGLMQGLEADAALWTLQLLRLVCLGMMMLADRSRYPVRRSSCSMLSCPWNARRSKRGIPLRPYRLSSSASTGQRSAKSPSCRKINSVSTFQSANLRGTVAGMG